MPDSETHFCAATGHPVLMGQEVLVIGPGVKTGIRIRTENPAEVGADLVANAVAAYERRDAKPSLSGFLEKVALLDRDEPGSDSKEKKLTNMRAAGRDENVILSPVKPMTLERAIHFIREDEMVEVTPTCPSTHCGQRRVSLAQRAAPGALVGLLTYESRGRSAFSPAFH